MSIKVTDEVYERRKAVLRQRGVPERFVEDFATRDAFKPKPYLDRWILVGHLFFALIIIFTCMFLQHALAVVTIKSGGLNKGSRLFYYSDLQVFAWSIPAFVYTLYAATHFGRTRITGLGRHPKGNQLVSWLRDAPNDPEGDVIPLTKHLPTAKTANAYIDYFRRRERRWALAFWVFSALSFVGFGVAGQGQYWRLVDDRIEFGGLFHGETLYLKDAVAVDIGCHTGGKHAPFIRFQVRFPGKTVALDDVGRALRVDDERKYFLRLESIGQDLRALGVPFRQYETFIEAPRDPMCFQYWAKRAGPNGDARTEAFFKLTPAPL